MPREPTGVNDSCFAASRTDRSSVNRVDTWVCWQSAETLYITGLQALQSCFLKKLCNLDLGYGVPVNICAVLPELDFPHSVWPDGFRPHSVWDMEYCKDT